MERSDINGLLDKYLAGTSTADENALLETWYMKYEDQSLDSVADQARIDQLERIRVKVLEHSARPKTIRLWPKIAVAAAAVLAMVIGVWFYNSKYEGSSKYQVASIQTNDIAPGKNGATITLANGKVIQLSGTKTGVVVGDELKYNDGSAVRNSSGTLRSSASTGSEVQQVIASTAQGQTYQFTLPDGTKVWLNADSKISFPTQFDERARKILLDGEGYFEVAKLVRGKEAEHVPFIVETSRQRIQVLGTHFNVNAYKDEVAMRTTLLEGRVKVEEGGASHILAPGNQAYSGLDGLRILDVDVEEAVSWQKGYFKFDNEDIRSIMRKVSRWYNVDVEYEAGVPEKGLSGSISRYQNVSKLLEMLQATGLVKFEISGKKVRVLK